MNSKALFVLFLVVAIFVATEARHLHCGKSLARFIYKVCKTPCQKEESFDFATYACTNFITSEYVRQQCCPNTF
ncbi:hypothetical protein CAEBREN_02249 [Caenorhabditis brenneri]|uniref:Uncharacterized protein n=1 Tax=Caenorhabditis brenneri TaxID=135651 RepID=G0MJA5_CAEBE|nr:hypothetical protein CAEBREN_02249 [Caenorhabditis brenneri]